jgi:hypothetical protein
MINGISSGPALEQKGMAMDIHLALQQLEKSAG